MKKSQTLADSICEIKFLVVDEADRMLETQHFGEIGKLVSFISKTKKTCYRTIITSATLVKANSQEKNLLGMLKKLCSRDDKPLYINLVNEKQLPVSIKETRINCLEEEKVTTLEFRV